MLFRSDLFCAQHYRAEEVRIALDVSGSVPVLMCDARKRESSKQVLITLVEHVLTLVEPSSAGSAR